MKLKRKYFLGMMVAALCLVSGKGYGQKYDYRWILGDWQTGNFDVIFSASTADTLSKERHINTETSSVTVSDFDGNLQFYSNGAQIYNSIDSVMQNGDSINYGWYWDHHYGADYNCVQDIT